MSDDLLSPAIALIGTGTWFANKIFGPSADAMGENLRVYLQSRMPSIFGRAEEKARALQVDLKPIPPGLAARMIMDASFSADHAEITDWWANLFVSAAHVGSNTHAVFSDMMAMIGPREAECLAAFFDFFEPCRSPDWFNGAGRNLRGAADLIRDEAISHWIGEMPVTPESQGNVYINLTSGKAGWPMRPKNWVLPYRNSVGEASRLAQTSPWFEQMRESIEILERTRVLRFARADVPVLGPSAWVETVEVTGIGADFYAACKGFELAEGAP